MTTFTPREIKNRKFKQSLMGADAEEVKDFLKIVAAEFDRILTQNALLEKRLTEQTVRSTLGTKKEAEKQRQTLESADKAAGEIIARAREEADGIRQQTERDLAELRRKTEREAHEKARRETALMLSQAKVMADEVILNAKQKAEKIEAEAKEALAAAAASVPDFERPLSIPPSPGEGAFGSDEAEDLSSEEALQNFDSLIAEARVKAETIIQTTRAEAEMVTSGLIGRTLGELNKEHERLLAAVQNAVHKSEEIVKA
ncbi:MAG TPA: DivIVA domain-containing protein, partial [Syntrophales bacterium]|nr:DivIVA domain-containing protein [Syntrophales bacterium]HPG72461.1 DivIVA domain-containing protein [Syntrophales bacterium]